MHMADALVSPGVGGVMWVASAAVIGVASHQLKKRRSDRIVPLMAVMGAFVFAAQMVNFTIPGTGSSGHLGGGLLLAALLGPHAAMLGISSVLFVQALFFADGGLLALGCNIFNLGFFPAYIAYPFIFRPLAGLNASHPPRTGRVMAASVVAAVAGLLLGAAGVVVQTVVSGVTAIGMSDFLLLMLPIHAAIGVVEGVVTALVVGFVMNARPEIVFGTPGAAGNRMGLRGVLAAFAVAAVVTGGFMSLFASGLPDGLEWSVAGVTGHESVEAPATAAHDRAALVQERTAAMPDYALADAPEAVGTGLSGLVGGTLTLTLAGFVGFIATRRRRS